MTGFAAPILQDDPAQNRIRILLCTYNGAEYLEAQLQSYLAQDHADWDLWVSDDGSTDATLQILQAFQRDHGAGREIRLLQGPGRGGVANYLSLLCHPDLARGPVALSDQDDVWMPHKLSRALAALQTSPPLTLYGAQSLHTDADLKVIGRSHRARRKPCFQNALLQNIVSGHSAVLSAAALELARCAGVHEAVPYHDWWLYQLVTGAGGSVVIDAEPVLYYRQHAGNAMGAHQGFKAKLQRLALVFGSGYGDWIAENTAALAQIQGLLTVPNRNTVAALLRHPRQKPLKARALRTGLFLRKGLHRQGRLASALLYLAVAMGRV